jgi:hypothetical protein
VERASFLLFEMPTFWVGVTQQPHKHTTPFPHFEAIQLDETQFLNPWHTFTTLNFGELQ